MSFCNLQKAFTTAPLFRHFDPLLLFQIKTDVLGFAILIIFLQAHPKSRHWHSIAFSSRKKASAERNYSIKESQMLAIVKVYKKWHRYVESATHQVVVIIDHANLQQFLIDKALYWQETQWWELLSSLDLSI